MPVLQTSTASVSNQSSMTYPKKKVKAPGSHVSSTPGCILRRSSKRNNGTGKMPPQSHSETPNDERNRLSSSQGPSAATRRRDSPPSAQWSFFTVPPAVKRLFDRFPIRTYPANDLPVRSPSHRNRNVLYIFTTAQGETTGAPSFNPGCLRWQVSNRCFPRLQNRAAYHPMSCRSPVPEKYPSPLIL